MVERTDRSFLLPSVDIPFGYRGSSNITTVTVSSISIQGNELADTLARKEKLSIYLVKDGAYAPEDCLKQEMVSGKYLFALADFGATLFVKREPLAKPPTWTRLFTDHPNSPAVDFGNSNNVGAVLHVATGRRSFLLSFGSGFHLVRGEMTERDFGLKVTLNAVDPEKLRSLDKASYDDNPLNSRTQSTLQVDIFDLQVNSESDLVYAVTGASKIPQLGSHITGRDSLTLMVETDLEGIGSILAKAIELFEAPLPAAYAWIDNVARVRDSDTVEVLDLLLDDLITKVGAGNMWLGEPEIVDWESNAGYSFDMYPNTARHQTLSIDDLRDYITSKSMAFNIDAIKNVNVHINDSSYSSIRSWPAYRCIYAEVDNGNDKYVIRNGAWFRIESNFVAQIDARLASIEIGKNSLPQYSFTNEGEYNSYAASNNPNIHLMDKNNIKTGGPHDKIEFCDLIEDAYNLIHVKYYRSSATLSHLFSQGAVAAETFIKDEDFRKKLNSKLPSHIALSDTSERPDASKYRITYAIATSKSLPSELPFFSKVTLKNAAAHLGALGFKVALMTIPVDPILHKTKKYKPKSIK